MEKLGNVADREQVFLYTSVLHTNEYKYSRGGQFPPAVFEISVNYSLNGMVSEKNGYNIHTFIPR